MDQRRRAIAMLALLGTLGMFSSVYAADTPVVPGSGKVISKVGDDFEDAKWSYTFRMPKSSYNLDKQIRVPGGESDNGRWFESAKRGQPDVIRRVPTPEGGLAGSEGSLLLATRISGVPGQPSWQMQQDDFLVNLKQRVGGYLPTSWRPSFVVRVYLPPFDKWEDRSGSSFGLRADVRGIKNGKQDSYWPGMFIQFRSKTDPQYNEDFAQFMLRAGPRGYDFPGPIIKQPGWWTLGMSFTPDGCVHYYAKPGVGDLTEKDRLASQWAYSFRATEVHTFLFNVANRDDGRTWSTPWIIDDPQVFIQKAPSRSAQVPRR